MTITPAHELGLMAETLSRSMSENLCVMTRDQAETMMKRMDRLRLQLAAGDAQLDKGDRSHAAQ